MSNIFPESQRTAWRGRITACAGAVLATACAMPMHPDSAAPPSDPFNPAATQLLDDTSWKVAAWTTADGRPFDKAQHDAATPLTLVLSTASGQRRASGFAGCNTFSGAYSLKGGKLSFGPLATTHAACTAEQNEIERRYLDALSGAVSTGVQMRSPQRLQIIGKDGASLTFARSAR